MGATGVDWQDHRDIRRWMKEWAEDAANGGLDFTERADPVDELRHRYARGDFNGLNAASVMAFLDNLDNEARRVSAAGQADREERAVNAAEASAKYARDSLVEAKRSADAAVTSSRWGGWAVGIAVAALLMSAWPYISRLWE